jgi:septum site-determining protein MinC
LAAQETGLVSDLSEAVSVATEPGFQLRGGSFTMMVLKLHDPANPDFFAQLEAKIAQAPGFFRDAPIVLDLDEAAPFDLGAFLPRLRRHGLLPVGIQGGADTLQEAARAAGLAVLPPGRAASLNNHSGNQPDATQLSRAAAARASFRGSAAQPAATAQAARATLMITEPVRSGRQIYAAHGDLVVAASVSAGAELVADGSIHVYGRLSGRALAGMSGDRTARIFCQSLDAELLSIAGLYRVSEDIDKKMLRQPVQVHLDRDFLKIAPLTP